MTTRDDDLAPPPEVRAYYDAFPEESRLETGPFRLEFERTKAILARVLPAAPARIVDVGGAAGAYSSWLAARGYEVHLVDASARLVEEARRRNRDADAAIASFAVADARRLPRPDASADAVLVMGPLYHLLERADRLRALREAARVAAPGALVVAAAISRFAPSLNGLSERLSLDPRFVTIRDRGLRDGRHRNDTGDFTYFTTAYLHRPDELREEMEEASLHGVEVLGVEGPGWMLPDLDERWGNDALRGDLLHVAGTLEREPAIVGASAHLLAIGRRARAGRGGSADARGGSGARPHTVILRTPRMDALADFYRRGFEWPNPEATGPDHVGFQTESIYVGFDAVAGPSEPREGPGAVSVWFDVADLEATFRRFVDLGARVQYGPTRKPWGATLAAVFDPDGNVVGLVQREGDGR